MRGQNLKALLQPVHDRLERYERRSRRSRPSAATPSGCCRARSTRCALEPSGSRPKPPSWSTPCAMRPRRGGAGASSSFSNVLETCGLSEHCDFATEVSVDDGEGGRLRPDVVIRVPGRAVAGDRCQGLAERLSGRLRCGRRGGAHTHLTAHAPAIRAHVNTLGAKAYWAQFDDAPDYVVMFIPGEHFLTAALEQDSTSGTMPSTRRCCWRPRPT